MNDVPGCRVAHVFGEVFGLTVRSRAIGVNFVAGLKSLGGGEITQYTQMLTDSRNEAVGRMAQMAMGYGANAVLAMRFDCNEIAQTMSEIAAYGTAVFITPIDQPQGQVGHQQQQQQAPHPQQQQPPQPPPGYQQQQQH